MKLETRACDVNQAIITEVHGLVQARRHVLGLEPWDFQKPKLKVSKPRKSRPKSKGAHA